METLESRVRRELFAMRDEKYRDFHKKLVPTVEEERIIGVRIPALRKYAKELSSETGIAYLDLLPHHYIEENNLHAFIISGMRDFDEAMRRTEEFLPYIDNWATCDSFMPKVFKKHPAEVYEKVKQWLKSERTYTVRYGLVTLLNNYLDKEFKADMLDLAANLRSEEYYINMAIAWYFSMALVKQYDAALPYIIGRKLDRRTHNKAIQKAIESYRISDETKAYLRTLKY